MKSEDLKWPKFILLCPQPRVQKAMHPQRSGHGSASPLKNTCVGPSRKTAGVAIAAKPNSSLYSRSWAHVAVVRDSFFFIRKYIFEHPNVYNWLYNVQGNFGLHMEYILGNYLFHILSFNCFWATNHITEEPWVTSSLMSAHFRLQTIYFNVFEQISDYINWHKT